MQTVGMPHAVSASRAKAAGEVDGQVSQVSCVGFERHRVAVPINIATAAAVGARCTYYHAGDMPVRRVAKYR